MTLTKRITFTTWGTSTTSGDIVFSSTDNAKVDNTSAAMTTKLGRSKYAGGLLRFNPTDFPSDAVITNVTFGVRGYISASAANFQWQVRRYNTSGTYTGEIGSGSVNNQYIVTATTATFSNTAITLEDFNNNLGLNLRFQSVGQNNAMAVEYVYADVTYSTESSAINGYAGLNQIQGCYVGSQQVSRIYKGSQEL